jgi:predicted nucleotidyltransferase
MSVNQIDKYRDTIVPILLKNDVDRAGIFGLFARNETHGQGYAKVLQIIFACPSACCRGSQP